MFDTPKAGAGMTFFCVSFATALHKAASHSHDAQFHRPIPSVSLLHVDLVVSFEGGLISRILDTLCLALASGKNAVTDC